MSSLPDNLKDIKKLTEIFEKLGAEDPEEWAQSQIDEGINQLGRYVLLTEMWKNVIDKHDTSWIDEAIKHADDENHWNYKQNHALKKVLDKGVNKQDLLDIIRYQQYCVLFDTAYILEGPRNPESLPDDIQDISWAVFQINNYGEPVAPIEGLHGDILEMDPQKDQSK